MDWGIAFMAQSTIGIPIIGGISYKAFLAPSRLLLQLESENLMQQGCENYKIKFPFLSTFLRAPSMEHLRNVAVQFTEPSFGSALSK